MAKKKVAKDTREVLTTPLEPGTNHADLAPNMAIIPLEDIQPAVVAAEPELTRAEYDAQVLNMAAKIMADPERFTAAKAIHATKHVPRRS